MTLQYSKASERNREPILKILKSAITSQGKLMEMGHGTGQHAMFFSKELPHVNWYAFDQIEYHPQLQARQKDEVRQNLFGPFELFVSSSKSINEQLQNQSCPNRFEYFFTANTLHIMTGEEVLLFCQQLGNILTQGAQAFIYGPFKFAGSFTSESNHSFDQSLRRRGTGSSIKDFEFIDQHLKAHGVAFQERDNLPANNQLLTFTRI